MQEVRKAELWNPAAEWPEPSAEEDVFPCGEEAAIYRLGGGSSRFTHTRLVAYPKAEVYEVVEI